MTEVIPEHTDQEDLVVATDPVVPALPPPLPIHPVANVFPMIEGGSFRDLVEEIATNGLDEKIVL